MKKTILAFAAAITIAATSQAAVLTPEEALNRVKTTSGPAKILSDLKPSLKMTRYVDEKPVIYLFSMGAEKGLIAVSADDCSIPLLGYTDEGTFTGSDSELPDGLLYWLNCLGEEIAGNTGKYEPRKAPSRAYIAPLIKTKWNQNAPFNNECPTINGTRCYTGCVATAMAQVLKYYSYPTKGIGEFSYEWNNQTLSFNYGATTFDWANMTDTYDSKSTAAQNAAVAKLMYACGVSVKMNYGTNSSGAVSANMVRAFVENFGYGKSIEYRQRQYYSLSDWEEMVYSNLQNYGPVLYGGQSNTGGHQFICDGYESGYFHFNWGWGGMSDGYFVLTALDPDSQGIGGSTGGYNFDQDIVIKLSTTDTTQFSFEQMCLNGDFTITPLTTTLGSSISCSMAPFNKSGNTISPTLGIQIVSEDGSYSTFIAYATANDLGNNYGWSNLSFSSVLPRSMSSGTYIVRPAFICSSGRNVVTPMLAPIGSRGSYIMTVNGNNVTFSAPVAASLSVSDLAFASDIYQKMPFKATAKLTNTSATEEYYQPVAMVAYDNNGSPVAMGDQMMLDLQAGETLDWEYVATLATFSGKTITAGKSYNFYLCKVNEIYNSTTETISYTFDKISGPISAVINGATSASLSISDLKVTTDDNTFTATATLQCSSGYFSGSLPLLVYPYIPGQSVYPIGTYNSDFISVAANSKNVPSTVVLNYKFVCDAAESNTNYWAQINYNGNRISNQYVFKTGTITGMDEIITESSEAVATEYYTLTGTKMSGRPTERGIYIVREYYKDGKITTKRIVF